MSSKRLSLANSDAKDLAWTFLDLFLAFVLTFGTTHVVPFLEDLDTGWAAGAAAGMALVIQIARKFLTDTRPTIDERREAERRGIKQK
jgi:hypothetical protein